MDYCLRLDDACPQMNAEKWAGVERILDKYKVSEWQKKGWTIALHGLHHELHFHEPRGYYQLSHSSKTEWAGKSSTEQYEMLKQGYQILKEHGLTPTCFFAPCHTYDEATVKAIALEAYGVYQIASVGNKRHLFDTDEGHIRPKYT